MKSRHRILTVSATLLAAAMIQTLTAGETLTDTQTSQANNLSSKDYGILLSVPDHLCRNVNDDQQPIQAGYEEWDRDHIPSLSEKDLREVTVTAKAGSSGGYFTLKVAGNVGAIVCPLPQSETENKETIYWKDGEKKNRFEEENSEDTHRLLKWHLNPGQTRTFALFIEGVENSETVDDIKFIATLYTEGQTPIATGETTVYEADLDIDSNNSEGLIFTEGSKAEDVIESSEKADGNWSKRPGKIVMVNDGFGDDIPDWADGFHSDPSNADTAICGSPIRFVPMLLERKKPFTDKCKVRFTYSASDPIKVLAKAGRGFPGYDKHFTKPAGFIRIWKKDNDGSTRSPAWVTLGGDFVLDNWDIPWEDLADGEIAHLWVEAVDPSGGLGDITIKAEITENGATCSDEIRLTAIRITCEPITAAPQSGLYPYNPAGIVAGEDAYFKIDVEPAQFPDEEIKWKGGSYASLIQLPKSGTTRFARFRQSIGVCGDGEIRAEITGNYYVPPKFNVKVFVGWRSYPINIYILENAAGVQAVNSSDIPNIISKVNEIHRQSGTQYYLSSISNLSGSPYTDYYDCDKNLDEDTLLTNHVTNSGAFDIYFVGTYNYPGVNVKPYSLIGSNDRQGIICRTSFNTESLNALSNTVAHEIGHSWGLEDIEHGDGQADPDSPFIDQREKAKRVWMSSDWPADASFNSDPSFYKRLAPNYATVALTGYPSPGLNEYAIRQNQIIRRLLMFGDTTLGEPDTEIDIPKGEIYGVRPSHVPYSSEYTKGSAKVGLDDMLATPELN
jgi:hypothetical protein